MKKRKDLGSCPLCDRAYSNKVQRTRHHIFPRFWYTVGFVVHACSDCHTKEFHRKFIMGQKVWTPYECMHNWVRFCTQKGKNAYIIYPELKNLKV